MTLLLSYTVQTSPKISRSCHSITSHTAATIVGFLRYEFILRFSLSLCYKCIERHHIHLFSIHFVFSSLLHLYIHRGLLTPLDDASLAILGFHITQGFLGISGLHIRLSYLLWFWLISSRFDTRATSEFLKIRDKYSRWRAPLWHFRQIENRKYFSLLLLLHKIYTHCEVLI